MYRVKKYIILHGMYNFLLSKLIFLNSLNFSIITAHEYIEQPINISITDFTIKSALKNKLHKEKSVFEARPTA